MGRVIEFFVPGKAEPAGSKRAFMRPGMKFPVVVDDNPKSKGWKKDLRLFAAVAMKGMPPMAGALIVKMLFTVARPKRHFGTKGVKPSAPGYPIVRPDVLKLARAVEDAMTQVVYLDDAQIVTEMLWKAYGDHPGVRVTVQAPLV